ncbi:MAG: PEP-CTERM sorting domain-containing protein [Armatimonadota bacterium]
MRWIVIAALLAVTAGMAHAEVWQWTTASGGNDHWYDWVAATGSTWAGARATATGLTYSGQHGYLATFTSEAEWNAYRTHASSASLSAPVWLGGYQTPGTDTPSVPNVNAAVGWHWVTGENWDAAAYASWGFTPGEPNNNDNPVGEDALIAYGWSSYDNKTGKTWNDMYGGGRTWTPDAMLVEYGGASDNGEGASTPEPTSLLLLAGSCLAGFVARRRRKA